VIGRAASQASLFYFAFAKEAAALTDDLLDPLDRILTDPVLVDLAAQGLGARRARSEDFGRPSIAPERVLRSLVLKHTMGWSFRQMEYELRANLIYRRFTRFFEDPIPDFFQFLPRFRRAGSRAHRPDS
jgi:hypothetical protein